MTTPAHQKSKKMLESLLSVCALYLVERLAGWDLNQMKCVDQTKCDAPIVRYTRDCRPVVLSVRQGLWDP
jgi:hypothetical protein